MATSEVRAKAAAARHHAIDVLINAFNRLEKLDEVSAGVIVDAVIAAAQAAPVSALNLVTEHAQAVDLELKPWTCRRCGRPTAKHKDSPEVLCNCDEPITTGPMLPREEPLAVPLEDVDAQTWNAERARRGVDC